MVNQKIDINIIVESYIGTSDDTAEEKEKGIEAIKSLFEKLIERKYLFFDGKSGMYFSTNDDKKEVKELNLSSLLDNDVWSLLFVPKENEEEIYKKIREQKKEDFENLIKKEVSKQPNIFYTFLGNLFQVSYEKIAQALRFIEENAVTNSTIFPKVEDVFAFINSFQKENFYFDLNEPFEKVLNQLKQVLIIFEKFDFDVEQVSRLAEIAEYVGMNKMGGGSIRIKNLRSILTFQKLQEYKIWKKIVGEEISDFPFDLSNPYEDNKTKEVFLDISSHLNLTLQQLMEIIPAPDTKVSIDHFRELRRLAEKINLSL